MDDAKLRIKPAKVLCTDLARRFSSTGISNDVSRETVSGNQRPEFEVKSSDREVRPSTEEATEAAKATEAANVA